MPPPGEPAPVIRVISYDADHSEARSVGHVSDLQSFRKPGARVVWINIDGLGDSETFTKLGELFGLHPLALEDVVNLHQRPKLEGYGDVDFIVVRMPSLIPHLDLEQVSMFAGALAGALVPVILKRMSIDPALAGGVVLTTVTDVVGIMAFIGLATFLLLGR